MAANDPVAFANSSVYVNSQLRLLRELWQDAIARWNDAFGGTGANITDATIASTGLTKAELTANIVMYEQLENFFGNLAVVTASYASTLQNGS